MAGASVFGFIGYETGYIRGQWNVYKTVYIPYRDSVKAINRTTQLPEYIYHGRMQMMNGFYRYKVTEHIFRLTIPLDTFKLEIADSGSIAYKSRKLWYWTGYEWLNY